MEKDDFKISKVVDVLPFFNMKRLTRVNLIKKQFPGRG